MAIATPRSARWAPALVAVSSLWVAALMAAPYAASAAPGSAPFAAAGAAYLTGRLVCHQLAARSFHLSGTRLPVCARCTGLYAGAVAGAIVALRRRRALAARVARRVLVFAAIPTAATIATAWAGWWDAPNVLRAVAAVPLGAAIAWATAASLDRGLE